MRPLLALSARSAGVSMAVVLLVGVSGGMVRLLPWVVAREVPFGLTIPFARVLLGAAVEMAVLVGLPVGVAIGAALFVERGEARALLALGTTPLRLVASLAAPGIVLGVVYLALAEAAEVESIGALSARLLSAGRASCEASSEPRRVDVPLVSFTWLCFPGRPRLAGRVPGLGENAWFSVSDLHPSADLGLIALDDPRLVAGLGTRVLRVHALHGTLTGLPRWGAPRSVSGVARGTVIAFAALASAVVLAFQVLARGLGSPLLAAGAAAAVALSMLATLHALDARAFPLVAYGAVPLSGAAFLGLLALFPRSFRRVARRSPG